MTRFVVDASAVLHLAGAEVEVTGAHQLFAPTLLRSQTLSALHEAVQRGELPADVARDRLARIGRMPIRLLGDAVLRRRAWALGGKEGSPVADLLLRLAASSRFQAGIQARRGWL
jgi:predicted nucleic acid-binding protein